MRGDQCQRSDGPGSTHYLSALGLVLLSPALLEPLAVSIQAQAVRGVVVEASTRVPVTGAVVELLGSPDQGRIVATTDRFGIFLLTAPRAGTFILRATHLAYLPEADTVRIGPAESLTIEVRMAAKAVPLEPVVVLARSGTWVEGFDSRRATGFGRFLTRQDIEARGASKATDLLRTMPGVTLTAQRRGSGSLLQMRGTAGLCQPSIWINGVMIVQSTGGTTVDDLLSPIVIEAVEVYNSVSSAPSEYRSGTCGVVLFWTRRGSSKDGGRVSWKKIAVGASAVAAFLLLTR